MPATVQRVSADAVIDERRGPVFAAMLTLQREVMDIDGTPVRLAPGMTVTAEIKLGRRRVVEFLLNPLQRVTAEGMRER